MKKNLLLIIACILLLASCRKSGDGTSNTLLLAEVYKNSLREVQYVYSTDKKLIRYNEYSTIGNQSSLFVYVLLEYGADGKATKWKVFSPNDTLNNFRVITYDNQGRISRRDWYFGGSLLSYGLYEYDQQDRCIKLTEKNGSNNANLDYFQYTYDDEGRITRQTRYYWAATNQWLPDHDYIFVVTGKNVYKHWKPYSLTPDAQYQTELNMASKHTLDYDNLGNIVGDYTDTATNKKYNASGYLLSQTITRKFVKPVKPDQVTEKEYVYLP